MPEPQNEAGIRNPDQQKVSQKSFSTQRIQDTEITEKRHKNLKPYLCALCALVVNFGMKLTLSADEKLIAKSRKYAEKHNTTLNNLVRDFLRRISGELDIEERAREFAALAEEMAGESEPGFRFDRD